MASLVENVFYYSGLPAKPEYCFIIQGQGFAEGDQLLLKCEDLGINNILEIALTKEGYAKVYFPDNLQSGSYDLTLVRGDNSQYIGKTSFQVVEKMPVGSKVIAHRGHWRPSNASQNSRASLKNAIELGTYGSEVDVWITTDGHLMCNHDESFQGVKIQESTYHEVQKLKLENGETMPELQDLFELLNEDSLTKLIIEIKPHSSKERNYAVVDSILSLVTRNHLEGKVEYISFSLDACQRLAEKAPYAYVSYLNGTKSPEALAKLGITGLDYTLEIYHSNPEWIEEARQLSLITNVWTIDNLAEIIEVNNLGIDYITTNYPERAMEVQSYFARVIADSINTKVFEMYKGKLSEVIKYLNNAIDLINLECPDVASSFLVEEELIFLQIKKMENELEALYKEEQLNSQYYLDINSIVNSIDDMLFRAKEQQRVASMISPCYLEKPSCTMVYNTSGVRINNNHAKGIIIIKTKNKISKRYAK